MKTLETTIAHSGYTLTQIWREGQVAVYSKQKANMRQLHSFEVVIVQVLPPVTINGKPYPEREAYPRSEEWGTYGWTEMTEERALARARECRFYHTPVPIGTLLNQEGRKLNNAPQSL